MLAVDPDAAAREIRRVLRPGGRAHWPSGTRVNATRGRRSLEARSSSSATPKPPDPDVPGLFALSAPRCAGELLEDAGFTEVEVTEVEVSRRYASVAEMVEESADVSPSFSSTFRGLTVDQQAEVAAHVEAAAAPFTDAEGHVTVAGVSLVARADA